MNKKLILITGATAGVGEAVAYALAAQGHELILVGRNLQKTENVAQQIRTKTSNQAVHVLIADFVDLDQIRHLAKQVQQKFPPLDVLINNAGAAFMRRYKTKYGVEKTLLVNHLAPFLLTNLLLKHLQSNARVINVASGTHPYGRLDLNDLNLEGFYFGIAAYARSKLANILFTYELARRLKNTHITVNALTPGRVGTDIFKSDFSIFGPFVKWFMARVSLTPEQGADNTVFLATSAEVEGVTSKFFVKRNAVASSPSSYDEDLAKRLWEVSEKLTANQ